MADTNVHQAVGADAAAWKLREMPSGTICYVSDVLPLSNFIRLKILDKTPDATKARELPLNELLALALNELAMSADHDNSKSNSSAQATGGFFQHLPNRDMTSKVTERDKHGRAGPSCPALIFMKFAWSESSTANFMESTHRTRYMAADFLANRPSPRTPLSCFQVAAHKTYPLFRTPHTSFVIIVTSMYLYLMACQDLEDIVGRWPPNKRNPSGADRSQQLETFPGLWTDSPSYQLWDAFAPYRHTSLQSLYDTIQQGCRPCHFTSGDLFLVLPRPSQAPPTVAFGTASVSLRADQVVERTTKSRRGERRQQTAVSPEVLL